MEQLTEEINPFWTVKRTMLAWTGILIVFFMMRATIVSIPLERDEGEYAYIADQIMNGGVPYRDVFDQKPPGIFFLYMVALTVFGRSVEGIHIFMYLWTLVTTILLYRLVDRLFGTGAGLLSALVLAIMTAEKGVLGSAANTEIFMLLPLVGSLLCLEPKTSPLCRGHIVGAGILLAVACWIKQVAAMNALFVAGWLMVLHFTQRPRRDFGQLILDEGCLLLGGLLASIPFFLYLYKAGALHDLLYCVFTYNFAYSSTEIDSPKLMLARLRSNLGTILSGDCFFWLALVAGLVRLTKRPRLFTFVAGLLILSFAGVCIGGYFRPHYFMQILPAVAMLAGIGLAWYFEAIGKARLRFSRYLGYSSVAAVTIVVPIAANSNILFAPTPETASVRLYGPTPFVFSNDLGEDIRSKTKAGDTILVAGTEPQIAFFARRKNATRYIFFNPLAASYSGVLENQKQAMEEIRKAQPKYIINLLGVYGNTIVTPDSEPYFFRALEQYEREQGFLPQEYWVALPETNSRNVPKCYQRLTVEQMVEYRQKGLKMPSTVVLSRKG